MNVIYISPIGKYNNRLFHCFKNTFPETFNPHEATHAFIEVQSGTISYDPNILDVVLGRRIPVTVFDNREYGPMQKQKWSPIEELRPSIYFVRNMSNDDEYPQNVYPFDWPYFSECDFPVTTKEELFSRPYDFVFTGTEAPTRLNFIRGLLKDGRLKALCEFRDHTKRKPYSEWIDEHRKGKFYVSCDGGGYTEERPQQLFSIAAMLKNKNNHLPAHPFTDGVNCIELNENPTSGDIEKLLRVTSDKDLLFKIYMNGVSHTKNNLSPEAIANYVLTKIKVNERA